LINYDFGLLGAAILCNSYVL